MRRALYAVACMALSGCSSIVDPGQVPSAQAAHALARTECGKRIGNHEFPSASAAAECYLVADRAMMVAIRLKKMDLYEAYASRVRLITAEGDAGQITGDAMVRQVDAAWSDLDDQITLAYNTDQMQRRQAASAMATMGASLQQAGAAMQAPASAPMAPVSCTSYQVGFTVQTSCH